jgi:alanyl-tRNA synthetase
VVLANQTADRIYYDEPATLEFTAEVTAIREVARVDGRQVWQIALDRTAFYPTSGGQPFDTGKLTATARSGAVLEAPITAVEEDDAGEVWHTTQKPLQEGTAVQGAVDASRRRDHMQQHTGQHLLSAILLRDCEAKTVSFHLGADTSTIDLDVDSLSAEQLSRAESAANAVIAAALPVSIRSVSSAEAEAMLAEGLLRKLPPREGNIRLIEIPGIDLNACGGTHVATTAEIGPLLLRETERVRGNLRLSFVCGDRAIAAARSDFQTLSALAQSLSTGTGEIAGSLARMQAEAKAVAKERAAMLGLLAELEAHRIAASGQVFVVHKLDPQQPAHDLTYAKLLASRIVTHTHPSATLIIAPETDRASVVLAAKPGSIDCGISLRSALAVLDGRGGGNKDFAQGALPLARVEDLIAHLQSELGR